MSSVKQKNSLITVSKTIMDVFIVCTKLSGRWRFATNWSSVCYGICSTGIGPRPFHILDKYCPTKLYGSWAAYHQDSFNQLLSPPSELFILATVLETIIRMWVSRGVEKVETVPCVFEPFTFYIRSCTIVSQRHEDDKVFIFTLGEIFVFVFKLF